ncbi:MAG: hypothetical protein ACPLRM_10130 [Anaerolineae bacterium]
MSGFEDGARLRFGTQDLTGDVYVGDKRGTHGRLPTLAAPPLAPVLNRDIALAAGHQVPL